MRFFQALPLFDWLALIWFFICWIGYVWFTKHMTLNRSGSTLLSVTNMVRREWMLRTTQREQRVIDAIITQALSTSPSFFASTTIIIIGGLLAMLGSTEKVAELFAEVPFSKETSILIFDLKILLLLSIFVFAFFRFSWSIRQYSFAALVIGSMPDYEECRAAAHLSEAYADKAGHVLGLAAETFNAGVRAYYFAFAALCWFFSPLIFTLASAIVLVVLYLREFQSDVLHVLRNADPS